MMKFFKVWLQPVIWIGIAAITIAVFNSASIPLLSPIQAVLNQLDGDAVSLQLENIRISPFSIIKALVLISIAVIGTGWLQRVLTRWVGNLDILPAPNQLVLLRMSKLLLYGGLVLVVLAALGVDLTLLAVFGSAIAIGLGFGLQKITANLVSGLILWWEDSFSLGDLIELDDSVIGYIRRIDLRYTLLETFNGKEIMVPNETMVSNNVTNLTYSNKRGRIQIPIGVSYDSDIDKARELIIEAAREHPSCASDPQPACFLREFADSSVNFLLFFWVDDVTNGLYGPQSEVMLAIWHKFKQHDIEIPFPQQDVHVKTEEARNTAA